MAKKQRRKKGDKGEPSTINGPSGDIEELSLSHSIVTAGSETAGSFFSADSWADDDDEFDQSDDGVTRTLEERGQKLQDAFAMAEDYCSEKRSTRRESTLRQWYTALTHYTSGSYETVESKLSDIIRGCQFSVRSGSPSEQYAACRVLETVAVLLADESLFEQTYHTLLLTTRSTHRAIPVRIAALRAIGMTVYIGVDDDVIVQEVMDLCEAVARSEYRGEKVAPGLRAAALTVWNVLATTLHEFYIAGADDVSTGRGLDLLPILVECLEQQEDLGLQSAAGECAAWIHSARLQLGVEDGEGDNTTERRYRLGSWEGSQWEDTMAEIEALMESLSNQSGHFLSKKKKKETRTIFRELLSTIQENEPPLKEVIQFRGGAVELTSWKDVIPMSFIRRCLQGGLQMQLMTNPTLQAIFGINSQVLNSSQIGMSQQEKRLLFSKASETAKEKDRHRTRKRQSRTNAKNLFLTNDD
mmetsp:Transcript_13418/g.32309  ORF Transcript_13418/g.32309 Transcript_13418/m.32309 type:complete len:471 (-) Transcript_13418:1108-2520(-)